MIAVVIDIDNDNQSNSLHADVTVVSYRSVIFDKSEMIVVDYANSDNMTGVVQILRRTHSGLAPIVFQRGIRGRGETYDRKVRYLNLRLRGRNANGKINKD